jgi:hypothetical protein
MSEDMAVHEHNATVMILHELVLVNGGNLIVAANLYQHATNSITCGDVNTAVAIDRCRDYRDSSRKSRFPQHLAVLSGHPHESCLSELNVLAGTVVGNRDDGGMIGRIGEIRRLPPQVAGLFIEGRDGALRPARSGDDIVAVHENGFGESPLGNLPTQL